MKLISFGYEKDFNLLPQFPVFIKPNTQKSLALYQLEAVPVSIKNNSVEADYYTMGACQQGLFGCDRTKIIFL